MSFLERRLHLGLHDLIVLGLNQLSWGAAALLTVLQYPEKDRTPLILILGVLVAFVPSVIAIITQSRGNRQHAREELEKRRRLAKGLIDHLSRAASKTMSRCPDQTGVVVFLPDDSGVLQTTYAFNKDGRPDADLRFEKHEGVTGDAWARKKQMIAHLEEVPEAELEKSWKLSAEYIRRTSHLKTIVATPIWSMDDPEQVIGIVSVDSELPDTECGIASAESQDEALRLARMLAHVMKLADLV